MSINNSRYYKKTGTKQAQEELIDHIIYNRSWYFVLHTEAVFCAKSVDMLYVYKGPSIKYVRKIFSIFDPPPVRSFCDVIHLLIH